MNTPAFPRFDGMSNNSTDIFRIARVLICKASLVHEPADDYVLYADNLAFRMSGGGMEEKHGVRSSPSAKLVR